MSQRTRTTRIFHPDYDAAVEIAESRHADLPEVLGAWKKAFDGKTPDEQEQLLNESRRSRFERPAEVDMPAGTTPVAAAG